MWRSTLVAGALALAQPAAATPFVPDFSDGPVVFDFEDGIAGWALEGSAWQADGALEWIETGALGGSHAIHGETTGPAFVKIVEAILLPVLPFAEMEMEVDLTGVGAIGFDHFFSGAAPDRTWFASPVLLDWDVIEGILIGSIHLLDPIPSADAGHRKFDLRPWSGTHRVAIVWGCFDGCSSGLWSPGDGYIDNVTFYRVPEPSLLALWAAGLLGLAPWRWRIAGKSLTPARKSLTS